MRYFFLIYALIALLVVGIFGLRGQKFAPRSRIRFLPMVMAAAFPSLKPNHADSIRKAKKSSAAFLNMNSAAKPGIIIPVM